VEVQTAADVEQALARTATWSPDLVLLDMNLGTTRGEEVIEALRAHRCDAGVILLTGTTDPERIGAGIRAGALDYVAKSALDVERLEEVVRFGVRVVSAERDLVRARQLAQRRSEQLARLVEASVDIATRTDVPSIVEMVIDATREILGAAVAVRLELDGRRLSDIDTGVAARSERLEMDLAGAAGAVHGHIAMGRDQPFDDSERLVALQLARICVSGADKLMILAEAQQNARERQEIVAVVSHDLRTPLQSVSLGIDSMALRLESSPEAKVVAPTLDRMRRSVATMTRLLGDLLDVSRIHDNAMSVRMASVDPVVLVHDVREQHLPIAQAKGLALVEEVVGRGTLVCDGARLQQALGNLLSNAVRHTDKGTITLRVVVSDDVVRFEVADTGVGVPPDVRTRLFERLFQVDGGAKRSGGLGLGLFIVKGIADAHRGRVGVESELGKGSTFFIELPRSQPAQATVG
jgi:signal transduction histidine kinase